jgi:hypothetical protein
VTRETAVEALRLLPVWLLPALLVGVGCGALAFLLLGRHLWRLPLYLLLGAVTAALGALAGSLLPASGPGLGELNLPTTVGAAALALIAARALRF